MAHHCVQPWQVLATQSPTAGLLGLALRGLNALITGTAAAASPATIHVADAADAADAIKNSRLVNFMTSSCGVHHFSKMEVL
jgi:hypothetical protein